MGKPRRVTVRLEAKLGRDLDILVARLPLSRASVVREALRAGVRVLEQDPSQLVRPAAPSPLALHAAPRPVA